ncbi:hypothetical protein DICPUDRAFT_76255 [Dictyostelium purpureum]|uniref:Uncharacterized protein n=1 Tax=Dictyostelium purpureum TaxID=5786 RepID=F0ZD27_DICPU|nr:uncharacterized protein DICPUDRAFT_76255 [Dictyostelium purpureum]EGC38195.1 hypothetical protein DICPUDRAFT_76255 [Dictyostelium purpureum]|eukprot:XP_003285322.1 hypothetical protein DICPUDRAFT_76255 [Dictyostelium purpureum]
MISSSTSISNNTNNRSENNSGEILSLALLNQYEKQKDKEDALIVLNPITSPFKVFNNVPNQHSSYGTANSIAIGSKFYIISAAPIFDSYSGDFKKEITMSIGSSNEQLKIIKLFVVESINIAITYSIHNLPFITNFINEIGRVRVKQLSNTSLYSEIYKEGQRVRKNGMGSGFTSGIIIKNLSHLILLNPEFAKGGDGGSLVVNDDSLVIGVVLSGNQNHVIAAKIDIFNSLFENK